MSLLATLVQADGPHRTVTFKDRRELAMQLGAELIAPGAG
jgi:hypothetical protein